MEELDLKEILKIFYDKKFLIIIITLLCMIIGGLYSYFMMEPKYKASTTIVLTKTDTTTTKMKDSEEASITERDILINQSLVSTYSEIVKSSTILEQVINNLSHLNLSKGKLRSNIEVSSVEDTEVIKISMIDENPRDAAEIANEIAKVFAEKVIEMYNMNNVYTLDSAIPPDGPYNINHPKYIAIFALIGIVISCGYIVILNIFDTTVKNKEEIERMLDVPVLVGLYKYDETKRSGGKRKWII